MSSSRATGTRWESSVRDYCQANGLPACERLALGGTRDRGDLSGVPGWLAECKSVRRIDLGEFMAAAERKAKGRRLRPVLLIRRRMRPVEQGYAVIPISEWVRLVVAESGT